MGKTKERTRNIIGDEQDVEFYARAVVNYPDHKPVSKPVDSLPSVVRITDADGNVTEKPAYTVKELSAIIDQGDKRPRPLTHDELELSRKNRRAGRADLKSMEAWYRSELRESKKGKRLQRARGGPEDQTLKGIELGDTLWNPIQW